MQPVNELGDVERLLDVLRVPGLPYQSFRKSIDARPSESTGTASARIETSFPLLAAALPELAGAVIPHLADAKQPEPATERLPKNTPDDAVPPYGHSPAVAAPPTAMPAAALATPTPPIFHKPANAPAVPTTQAPPRPVETPIRGVFNILRGTPGRQEAETTSQRGIRTLFHRP